MKTPKNNYTQMIFAGFLVLEFILYCSFLWIDFNQPHLHSLSNILKYFSITACFVTSVLLIFPVKQRRLGLLEIGFFMTLLADFFLLFTIYYPVGIFFFCIVQLFYHFYLFGTKRIFLFLGPPSIITVLVLIYLNRSPLWLNYVHGNVALIVPACFYITMLLMNLISCFFSKVTNAKGKVIFFFALALLFICDLQVGYFNIHSIILEWLPYPNLWHRLYKLSSLGMWFFYLPSQVLLISYLNSNIKGRNFIK